jgi:WD40 repeat protein
MLVLNGTKRHVTSVAFSPDGTRLASGAAEGAVRLWNALDGTPLGVLPQTKGNDLVTDFTVRFAPGGRHLVVASSDYGLTVWDVVKQRRIKQLIRPSQYAVEPGIGFTADGRLLAARGHPTRGGLLAWDTTWAELPPLWKPAKEADVVTEMAVEPDGPRVALGDGLLIDSRTGEEVGRWGGAVKDLAKMIWASGRSLLAIANRRNTIEVYDPNAGRQVGKVALPSKYFEGCAFTPGGRYLIAVGTDGVARMYDTDTWAERQAWHWKVGQLKSIAVSQDGCRAAAGSAVRTYAGKIVIWDLD